MNVDELIIDCDTGERSERAFTPAERAERDQHAQRHAAVDAAQQARLDRVRALRSKQGPLTPVELAEAVDLLLGRS